MKSQTSFKAYHVWSKTRSPGQIRNSRNLVRMFAVMELLTLFPGKNETKTRYEKAVESSFKHSQRQSSRESVFGTSSDQNRFTVAIQTLVIIVALQTSSRFSQ